MQPLQARTVAPRVKSCCTPRVNAMTSTTTVLERLERYIVEIGEIDPMVIDAFRTNECWNVALFTTPDGKYSSSAIQNVWALVKAASSPEVQQKMSVGRLMFFQRHLLHILSPQDSNAGPATHTSNPSSMVAAPSSTRIQTNSGAACRYVVHIISFRCCPQLLNLHG